MNSCALPCFAAVMIFSSFISRPTSPNLIAPYPMVPVYDAVIYCDLGLEPPWVYHQLEFTRKACEDAGIFFKVLDTPLYQDFLKNFGERRTISIPWWTIRDDGHKSKMPRNCTIDYKVEEISKFVRWELLGYKKGQRLRPEDMKAHEMHMGFSIYVLDR